LLFCKFSRAIEERVFQFKFSPRKCD
jgi:hypothetical protein